MLTEITTTATAATTDKTCAGFIGHNFGKLRHYSFVSSGGYCFGSITTALWVVSLAAATTHGGIIDMTTTTSESATTPVGFIATTLTVASNHSYNLSSGFLATAYGSFTVVTLAVT